ncbi:MAG TPA: alkaline phosphatase family protein [Chthoniobacteraceae bacterium]|jgi:predicted AlkP superfamily pyrophosphatase or phosphodiesterase|nr:alkaline phosphatase family protein [Chthoniobacteraceae bacterium]
MKPLLTALAIFLTCAALSPAAEPIPAKDRTVVLISIDGFPQWMWRDPTLTIPTLRRLAREGAVAEAMTVSNPSITWINHTTMVTGVTPRRHGVLFNGLLVRQGPTAPPVIEQWRDKADLVRVPTIYDAAHAAGLKTGQADWVAILNSGTIDSEMLEIPKVGGELEQELVKKGVLTQEQLAGFTKGTNIAWRDTIWAQAIIHMIETRQSNLLLYHPLNTDNINHMQGPGSFASFTAYAYVDRLVGDIVAALEKSGRPATVFITTDHGFKKVSKVVLPNVVLRKEGLLHAEGAQKVTCDAYAMVQGGLAFVYVTDPAKRAALKPRLRALFEKTEGVQQVLDGHDGPTLGMPTPEENQGMGDLILYAKPTYAFQGAVLGEAEIVESKNYLGTHGYPAGDPELDGIFLAWGYGIKPGTKLGRVSNTDIAPTMAEVLGVKMPEMEGRVLAEALALPK